MAIAAFSNKKESLITTQNIDNLHQLAGSINVNELHGNIFKIQQNNKPLYTLTNSNFKAIINNIFKSRNKRDFKLSIKSIIDFKNKIRPDVVLFGEGVNTKALYQSINFVRKGDCVVVVGTSLSVFPAANIIDITRKKGVKIINIGFETLNNAININENALEILPILLDYRD